MNTKYLKILAAAFFVLVLFVLSVYVVSANNKNDNDNEGCETHYSNDYNIQNDDNHENDNDDNDDNCTPTPTPTQYHNICFDNACVSVLGSGENQCTENSQCEEQEFHYSCVDNQCVRMEGPGESTCETNANCSQTKSPTPTPTQTLTNNNNGGGGGGGSSPQACSDQKPNLPLNVTAVAGPGAGQVTLSWTAPQGPVTNYSIAYSDNPNTQKWGVPNTGNVTSYVISDLSVNKYYFWLTAVNGCMPGDQVGPVTVGGTGGPAVLGASTGPAVLGLSYTSSDTNYALLFTQLLASLVLSLAGFTFFRKNA